MKHLLTDRKLIFSSFTMDTADGDGDHEAGCSGDEDDDFCKDGVDGDGDGVEAAGFKY